MDDLTPDGARTEESIAVVSWMKEHGLDLANLSHGVNTNQASDNPSNEHGYEVERANRVREEVSIPFATSWNLGGPEYADSLIKERRSTSSTSAARCSRTRTGLSDLRASTGTTPPSDSFRKTGNGGFATRALTPRQ